ncbi:carboxypeptidase regulatory-like domain-containing protein, partial [bacterium]|nr:carboxypeptidase regulatory-like domain-containing protein [bacterium]
RSKYYSEQEVWKGIRAGLNAVIVNPGVILGFSGTDKGSSELFARVRKGLPFYTLGGSGYIDVQDVVKIMIELTNSTFVAQRYILVAENCSNKDILSWMADGYGKKKPGICINKKTLLAIGSISELLGKVFGFTPTLDRSMARSAQTAASKKTLKGKVVAMEKNAIIPLEYATVRLLSLKDSTLIAGTTTDEFGDFVFNSLSGKTFLFTVSCVGYQSVSQHIVLNEKEAVTQLKNIILKESAVALAEATVVAQRTEMSVKNDTVEYDAAAYKLRDNAVVEDLLKRLPGITITEDGKILVNGKEVKKVMVDGKDFFRSNPNL